MNLSELSIKRPVFITMIIMAIMVLGLFSLDRLPVEMFPKVDIPYVTVITVYPGASPEEIETNISDKLEDEFSSLSELKSMRSQSQENVSMVILEFKIGSDLDAKAADVRDKINAAKYLLPDDAEDPIVYKLDLDSFPIMFFAVSADRPLIDVRKTAEDVVKKEMEKIPGVATVGVFGGKEREIQIVVDRNRLAAKNMNILQIVEALRKDNLNVPVGKLKRGTQESLVRVIGEYVTVEEIERLEIPTPMGNVRISDVAEVKDAYKDMNQYARLGGENAVNLSLQKQSGANTVAVSEAALKEMAKIEKRLPGYRVALVADLSRFIKDAVGDVKSNLLYGALFTTIMIILFLKDSRSTMIIILAIPTAIISTFMPVYWAGFTINFMSLMGLAVAVGTLVDNSTVVLENIYRHIEMGKEPRDAARDATREVGLAVLASGTTNICVYMPVAFMSGMTGQFFKEFGYTVTFATLFSIFIAFTLTPAMAARFLTKKAGSGFTESRKATGNVSVAFLGLVVLGAALYLALTKWIPAINEAAAAFGGPAKTIATLVEIAVAIALAIPVFKHILFPVFDFSYGALETAYPKILAFSLKWRFVVVIVVTLMFLSSVAIIAFGKLGFEFVGQGDTGEFQVGVEMPPYASLDDTDAVIMKLEKLIEKIPEVEVMSSTTGSKLTSAGAESSETGYGYVRAKLVDLKKRNRSTDEVMQELRTKVADVPDAIFQISQVSMGGPPGQLDLQIEVKGPNLDKLVETAEKVEAAVKSSEGCIDVVNSWKIGKQEVHVEFNKQKMKEFGLDIATVAMTIRTALEGDDSAKFREGSDEYDVRVRFRPDQRVTVEDVGAMSLPTMKGPVKISSLATITQMQGPTMISRKNGIRMIEIGANLAPGAPLGQVQQQIEKAIHGDTNGFGDDGKSKGIDLPPGYEVAFAGQSEDMKEMFFQMIMALMLAVAFVYMVMAAQFESYFDPFVIMFTLPLTMIGVIWSLFIAGMTLNIMSMIGIVMLTGIVVNNAIVYIDFVKQYRAQGMSRHDALMKAGPIRLRPIMITSMTTICGMMPAALLPGSGGGFRQPMAVAGLGGMVVSTMLTLIVIPVTYTLVEDFINFVGRVFSSGRKNAA